MAKPKRQHPSLELLRKSYRPSCLGRTKDGRRVSVRHKHDCRHWSGQQCDCKPEMAKA